MHHPKGANGVSSRTSEEGQKQYGESKKRAEDTIQKQFGLKTLFIRYGLPAMLLGITGHVFINILVAPNSFFSLIESINGQSIRDATDERILLGIKFGTLGAYIFMLLELGRRTFRHDITGASAMWCLVTLVLGPVLAATVAVLWRMDSPQTTGGWGSSVVLFFTGFAPRRVIAAIEQAAVQLLRLGPQTVVETRLIPLSKIRGISPQIEERLSEEGIMDAHALAAAEPIRLVRNTSFDMRQILSWIDEAMLIVTLPKSWEALEDEGVTGAIDLAWYYEKYLVEKRAAALATNPAGAVVPVTSPTPILEQINQLAGKAKLSEANFLSAVQRLFEDKQVGYIWTLYNDFTEYSGGGDA